ncbi:MAG: HAMP domain-containing histidine kinase, partial [Opitutae bacterium]|nr:HAMP domain-containing histidine kinase [Opitutae bacterium]
PELLKDVQARFAEMREASLDMERKVNGLLQLSRLDQNAVAAECRSVPLRAFVQAAWERLGGPEPRRFDNRLPPAAAVRTDPEKLGMIVENLLRNARDYSPADAAVAVYPDPAGDSDYAICFANPAPDLAPADLDHLFERFWRKDAARSSRQRFGLGLSIVKALADLLDVRIQTRLAPDGTFVVRLAFPRREDS